MSSSGIDALRRLRDTSGAPLVECRAALVDAAGDEDAARARLRELAIERITSDVGCTEEEATAGYAHFGWDLARASEEARRQMLDADPALAVQLRRRWQLDTLHGASCCEHLMPIVYEADLQTLAESIGSVAEIVRLLEDRSGTRLGHVFDDASDWMESTLTHVEAIGTADAIELVKLVRGKTRDHIGRDTIDFTAADAYIGKLYPHLRAELRRVLDIDER